MPGSIFISYRREDSQHAAGRLFDHLVQKFRRDQLFMDVDAIEPGLDFAEIITEKVAACDVLLAVIGRNWLTARNEEGTRRIDDPNDFVRLEIEAALQRKVRVIPILVDAAVLPKVSELPESIQPLVRRNAVRIVHERFAAEASDLVAALQRAIASSNQAVSPNAPAGVTSVGAVAARDESPSQLAAPLPSSAIAPVPGSWPMPRDILTQAAFAVLGSVFVWGLSIAGSTQADSLNITSPFHDKESNSFAVTALILAVGCGVARVYWTRKYLDIALEAAAVTALWVAFGVAYVALTGSAKELSTPGFIVGGIVWFIVCAGLVFIKARKYSSGITTKQ